jgi:hypothetical protein
MKKKPGFLPNEPEPLQTFAVERARGFNWPWRMLLAATVALLSILGFAGFFITALMLAITQDVFWSWLALASIATFFCGRFLLFLLSHRLHCPLCHGCLMRENRAHKHAKAFRLWPLSYRDSMALMVILRWQFRCLFCGTLLRLRWRRQ